MLLNFSVTSQINLMKFLRYVKWITSGFQSDPRRLSRTNVSCFSLQKTGQEQLFKKTFCGMFADQKICKECNHRWAVIMTPLHVGVCKCGKPRSFMLDISTERSTVWSITLQGRSINLNRYLHSLTQNNKYSVVPCTQNPWFQIFRCIFTQFGRTKHRSWLCSRNIHCLRS